MKQLLLLTIFGFFVGLTGCKGNDSNKGGEGTSQTNALAGTWKSSCVRISTNGVQNDAYIVQTFTASHLSETWTTYTSTNMTCTGSLATPLKFEYDFVLGKETSPGVTEIDLTYLPAGANQPASSKMYSIFKISGNQLAMGYPKDPNNGSTPETRFKDLTPLYMTKQ